jgi:hydrogenase maturation protease
MFALSSERAWPEHAAEAAPNPTARATTLILGVGNILRGDDGIGAAVVDALLCSPGLPPSVQLADGGTPGLDTVLLLQGAQRAIIVDAADLGGPPGSWARVRPDQLVGESNEGAVAVHSAGLAQALALAEALRLLPAELVIYAIQPESLEHVAHLSQPVRAAVPAVCQSILDDLRKWAEEGLGNGEDPDH